MTNRRVIDFETTRYYIDRLRAFYSIRKIATIMKVSVPTINRWIDETTLPHEKHLDTFRSAITLLYNKLRKESSVEGDFFYRLCTLLIEDVQEGMPHTVMINPKARADKSDLDRLDDELERLLHAKPRMRSRDVIKHFEKKGFNRMQIYRSAERIEVVKRTIGLGRRMKSYWSLK